MKRDLLLKGGRLYRSEEEAPSATGETGDSSVNSPSLRGEETTVYNKVPARDLKKTSLSPRPEGARPVTVGDAGALAPLPSLPLALRESFVHLSETQFEWLSWRLGCDSDDEANELAGVLSVITEGWRDDPLFESAYQRALENKREAFRVLGTHLLPKALRVINKLLTSESIKANTAGLQYLLKTQALLDQPQKDQSEQVARLLEALRVPGHVTPVDITPRE